VEPFAYESTREIAEADYRSIHSLSSRRTRRVRLVALGLLGAACLFWSYTLLLGVVLLSLVVIHMFIPRILPAGMKTNYQLNAHLHQRLTFSVSDQVLRVSAPDFEFSSSWPNVYIWHERDGWLRVSPHGMQDLYFTVAELEAAGVYERILELCRKHGREFESGR